MSSIPVQQSAILSDFELRDLLLQYRSENWRGIQTPEWQEQIVEDILRDDGQTVLGQLAKIWFMPPQARLLDVGSGVGSFVVACRRRGLNAFGVEPDRIGGGASLSAIQIARRRTEAQVFAVAVGESLPFDNRIFDLVTMNQVMEHVSDQGAVLREAVRVLRDGGIVYVACPNYLRFYEPHYKIFWLPLLPKRLGRWYLRLRGRNPVLLDQLTYTTNARLRSCFKELGQEYTYVDLHREEFLKKCDEASFSGSPGRVVARLTRLPVLGPLIRNAALLFLRVTEGGCQMVVRRRTGSAGHSC
jgi:SAM-dependent methyltransferase